ncbi:MAG: DNA repair protein RadA [Armatimonadetes bacterium]|nr:MAG: DNA repair protein RadA [Armatimonadota bacterium]
MSKVIFACSSCGYESNGWLGKCPECGNWNSFEQIPVGLLKDSLASAKASHGKKGRYFLDIGESIKPQKISNIKSSIDTRISTGFSEFDRVLGGQEGKAGVVLGSVVLLSGDPGVGKSTLLLQLALKLSETKKVLYITGEESGSQVMMRAERIVGPPLSKASAGQGPPLSKASHYAEASGGRPAGQGGVGNCNLFIFSATNIETVGQVIEKEKPDLVIVDSIQTMISSDFPGFAGSVPQIRYATSRLVGIAKKNQIPIFLVGHVTKEGIVAGPMILSHMVDTVLYLEGESLTGTRILRSFKNRFGDTSEVGIFIMEERGLKEIGDVSGFFTDKKDGKIPGTCVTVVMEGSRPILVEIQALVVPSPLSFPRRVSAGINDKRLELLIAVLQKHLKLPLYKTDVFLNVVGGIKINETVSDLAVCLSIISSYKNKPLSSMVALGEIGLLGELKNVSNLDKRIKEAKKFGFEKVLSVKDSKYLDEAVNKI